MAKLDSAGELRIAESAHLMHYFRKRADSLEFYRRVRQRGDPPPNSFSCEHALFHSWLPGFIDVDNAAAEAIRGWMLENGPAPALPEDLTNTLATRGWCRASATPQLDHLIEKAFAVFPAIQNPEELRRFLDEVAARTPRVVVEIGTGAGGMLYCLSQLAHREALLVSIDFPDGPYGEGQDEEECQLFATFTGSRQRLAFIRDRSFHYSTKQDLARLLDGREIDLLFIDGDHSYAGAKSDFEMYGSFVAPGGLIAFHDIMMFPETWGRGFDVGILWRELAKTLQTREIVDPDAPLIPPPLEEAERLGMPALGFGLVISR
jgi:predicted O-methyltransferase YrrM